MCGPVEVPKKSLAPFSLLAVRGLFSIFKSGFTVLSEEERGANFFQYPFIFYLTFLASI